MTETNINQAGICHPAEVMTLAGDAWFFRQMVNAQRLTCDRCQAVTEHQVVDGRAECRRCIKAEIAANKSKSRTRDKVLVAIGLASVVALGVGAVTPTKPATKSGPTTEDYADAFLDGLDEYRVGACKCENLACWEIYRVDADKYFRAAADRGIYLDSHQAERKTNILLSIGICKEGLR